MTTSPKIDFRWKVELIGDTYLIKSICAEKNPSDELSIFEENGHFYLTYLEFENLTSVDEVKHKAEEIIDMINGIAFHLFALVGKISSNSITKVNDFGGSDLFVFPETVVLNISIPPPSITVINEDGSSIKSGPISAIQNLLTVAKNSPSKAKILRLCANRNLDWVSLYRLYEVVYSDVGNKLLSWTSKSKIQKFKHTCNSISAIGDASRHGLEITTPPKNPMTLIEAQDFIKLIIDKYLGIN